MSPDTFSGAKGQGGMVVDGPAAAAARGLGQGWMVSPCEVIEPGATFTLADIAGPGAIQQIWMTLARGKWRHSILRAYNFDPGLMERDREGGSRYTEFTTPYAGLPQVIRPDGVYQSQQRFGLYRWHIMDPVRFAENIRVTIQALGWRTHKRRQYLPLQDDIASVAYWYQALPTAPFPALPDRDFLEVI